MTGRRLVILYIALAIVLALVFLPSRSSSYVSMAGVPTAFVCDGSTHADDQVDDEGVPACGTWGVAILNDHLEYPPGIEAADIERLEMEQALWGYLDQCTVTAFVKDSTEFEQDIPCRPMAEPLSRQ